MKKIFSIMLAIALLFCINVNVFAEDFVNNGLNKQNEINVSKYVKEFVNIISENKNLEIGDIKQLYDENEDIIGFCVDLMDGGESNGYVIVKFSNNNPVVSEFAIDRGIKNPYIQLLSNNNVKDTIENFRLYSIGANEYQIIKENDVLSFNNDIMSNTEFRKYNISLKNSFRSANTYDDTNYSKLDGWSVVSDSYTGSVKSSKTLSKADSIKYYDSDSVRSINKTYGCSIVALSNLMKYYRTIGYTNISSNFSTLYSKLWNYAGTNSKGSTNNGSEAPAAKKYIESVGYKLSYDGYWFDNYGDFVRDINAGKPCLFTYGAKFGDDKGGHAVLVLGYVETTDYKYLKVADGWNHYLRYINFDGYDYNRKDGWSFGISK